MITKTDWAMEQIENAREWVKRGWNRLMTAGPDRMQHHIVRKMSPNNPIYSPFVITTLAGHGTDLKRARLGKRRAGMD
jgi:hypothetical protein